MMNLAAHAGRFSNGLLRRACSASSRPLLRPSARLRSPDVNHKIRRSKVKGRTFHIAKAVNRAFDDDLFFPQIMGLQCSHRIIRSEDPRMVEVDEVFELIPRPANPITAEYH